MLQRQRQKYLLWHVRRYTPASQTKDRRIYYQYRLCGGDEATSRAGLVQQLKGSRVECRSPFNCALVNDLLLGIDLFSVADGLPRQPRV